MGTGVLTAGFQTSRARADVAIVGAGPAGLAAAAELASRGAGRVIVLEREAHAGGIPRHAQHPGFGMRDLHRMLSGPAYAAQRIELARRAGAELRTGTQVTGWSPAGELELTGPGGRGRLGARQVLLATGCRERPPSARLVAGDRPQGVMTTGMLQQLVYLQGERPGRRALVVGAEHVSFSALLTLAHGGASVTALVTPQWHHQSFAAFRWGAALRFRVPLRTCAEVVTIHGRRRVEAVGLRDLRTGRRWREPCDTVVFTGDWIPDHELAVAAGIELDPRTRGPAVDLALRTSRPGVFAAGNVLQGAETADIAALQGRHAAARILEHLNGPAAAWPERWAGIRLSPPLYWISPNVLSADEGSIAPRGPFLLRAAEELLAPLIEVTQADAMLWRGRLPRVMAGRSAHLPASWTTSVQTGGSPVEVRVLSARRRGRNRSP